MIYEIRIRKELMYLLKSASLKPHLYWKYRQPTSEIPKINFEKLTIFFSQKIRMTIEIC